MPSDKPPKPRIDLRGPKYPPALFVCPAVLVAQALLADNMDQLITLTFVVFGAAVLTLNASGFFAAARGVDARPVLVLATALLGLMLGLRLGPAALWWAAAALAALSVPLARLLDRREARLKAEGRRAPRFLDRDLEDRVQFVELLARVGVEFARADGPFTERKRAAILDLFTGKLGYEGARLGSVRLFITEELGMPQSLNRLLRRFRHNCSYDAHLTLLELLFRVARASGPDTEQALSLAREIGLALDLSPRVVRDMEEKSRESEADRAREEARRRREEAERQERTERARREQEQAARRRREEEARRRRREQEEEARRRASESAYRAALSREARAFAVLELAPGAKFATIKKRYRRLIARHHPDKAAHLGEAARRAAEERSKELNAAYGYLKERYGG